MPQPDPHLHLPIIHLTTATRPHQPANPPPLPSSAFTGRTLAAIGKVALGGPLHLTPNRPYVEGKGYLDFALAALVEGSDSDRASFDPNQGQLIVGVFGAIGSQHLISCGTNPYAQTDGTWPKLQTFTIADHFAAAGLPPLAELTIAINQPLSFVVQLAGPGSNEFAVASEWGFVFHWCQIIALG